MREMMLMAGLCSVVALSLGACGSDVEDNPTTASSTTTATTGGNGGAGGAGGAPATSSSMSSSSAGGAGSLCDQACDKIAVECGAGQICDMPPVNQVLDCSDPASECPGQCILDADCAAIFSIVSMNPDPTLLACLQGCQGGQGGAGGGAGDCQTCLISSCQPEFQACISNMAGPCAAFLNCASMCMNGDGACYNTCAANNPSPETTALVDCATNNCSAQCGLGMGSTSAGGGS